ncbi:MAG: methylated-DNA--[protein]-cysteine S-methyltransferase [Thiomicrospira sp.]|jgi:O-6-methylguanine DNA methyltransferase|nr:methylated-DNA--[protein]-cysteine S-methyltransferase [Thiomicrospira sp.]
MNPSTRLHYAKAHSCFGEVFLVFDHHALYACDFACPADQTHHFEYGATQAQYIANLIGQRDNQLTLHPIGTPFQQQVWQALQHIPYGETRPYQAIAQAIGRPNAVRAVANAIAHNPISWFIPCHRVIRSNGQLGGFAWGSELKKTMLDWEQRHARA